MAGRRINIEQKRAAYAFEQVTAAKGSLQSKSKEYKSYSRKIPMLIKSSGLGSTIAFVYAKGFKGGRLQEREAYGLLYQQTEKWLQQQGYLAEGEKMIHGVIRKDSKEYRSITNEVFALYNWLRRFAEGMIEGEAEEN